MFPSGDCRRLGSPAALRISPNNPRTAPSSCSRPARRNASPAHPSCVSSDTSVPRQSKTTARTGWVFESSYVDTIVHISHRKTEDPPARRRRDHSQAPQLDGSVLADGSDAAAVGAEDDVVRLRTVVPERVADRVAGTGVELSDGDPHRGEDPLPIRAVRNTVDFEACVYCLTNRPVSASHTRIVPSEPDVATFRPSGLNAIPLMLPCPARSHRPRHPRRPTRTRRPPMLCAPAAAGLSPHNVRPVPQMRSMIVALAMPPPSHMVCKP